MRLLQSTDGVISPRLDNPRGISLGQHVLPTRLPSWRRVSISRLSTSSVTTPVVAKYFDFDGAFSTTSRLPHTTSGAVFDFRAESGDDDDADDLTTKNSLRIFVFPPPPPSSNTTPSSSSMRFFLRTSGFSSPHAWQNPPTDPSDATTLCQGTASVGPWGFRPMADPTALADVPSSMAMEPYDRTDPLGIVPTTSYTLFWKGVRDDDPSSVASMMVYRIMDRGIRDKPPPKNVERGIYEYVYRLRYSLKLIQKIL